MFLYIPWIQNLVKMTKGCRVSYEKYNSGNIQSVVSIPHTVFYLTLTGLNQMVLKVLQTVSVLNIVLYGINCIYLH
jgi:hypothetical protein